MSNAQLALVEREILSSPAKPNQRFVPYPEVVINGNILYEDRKDPKTKNVTRVRIGRAIEISSENIFLEDQKISYDLKIYTKNGPVIEKDVSRTVLINKEELLEMAAKGSDVNNSNYKIYINSLQNQEEALRSKLNHKKIGWDNYQGQEIYKHVRIVANKDVESEYSGSFFIETKGTLEDYKQFLKEEVIGHTPLEALVALGLSGVVVGKLDKYNTNIFNLYGNSTTGKTTAAYLAVSLASKPTIVENGLMMNWNSTSNALIGKLRDKNGIPMVIDDSSVSKIKDFTSLLYQLESGRDKERMDKESELKEAKCWKIALISTGESSLLENSNKNDGLRVRVNEFEDVIWTESAKHSNRIKDKASKYYGLAVGVVAKGMLKLTEDATYTLLREFEDEGRKYLEEKNKINDLTERKLMTYGTVRLAIELFERQVELAFNMEEIEKFLLDNMFKDQRLMWHKALESLKSYVESNINRFNRDVMYDGLPAKLPLEAKGYGDILGKISDVKIKKIKDKETGKSKRIVEREILILRDKFDEILKELGFTNPKGALKDFKDNDILSCEGDRLTRTRKISDKGSSHRVVVIKTEEEYIESEEMKEVYYKRNERDKENKRDIKNEKSKTIRDKTEETLDELLGEDESILEDLDKG